jgi:hypothetical protein
MRMQMFHNTAGLSASHLIVLPSAPSHSVNSTWEERPPSSRVEDTARQQFKVLDLDHSELLGGERARDLKYTWDTQKHMYDALNDGW